MKKGRLKHTEQINAEESNNQMKIGIFKVVEVARNDQDEAPKNDLNKCWLKPKIIRYTNINCSKLAKSPLKLVFIKPLG